MSKLSIYESGWLNLVFEGRNKEYGAYQLRQETGRTTMTAFAMGLLLIASLMSITLFANYLTAKNAPAVVIPGLDTIIHVVNIEPFKPKTQTAVIPPAKKQETDVTTKKQLKDPVVVSPIDAEDVAKKGEHPVVLNPTLAGQGTAVNPVTPTAPGTVIPSIPPVDTGGGVNLTTALDKLPEFPGGIEKFYTYVGRTFEKPEFDDVKTIKVYVSFVIEKDGSMTDIQVRRDPGYGLGKEAIRVLKSLKTKWSPGMIAGKPVRTSYNLPITVQMQ